MISLAFAKYHLRVEHSDDDSMIQSYIDASLDWLSKVDVDTSADPLPASVCQAALLMVAHFYENREAVGYVKLAPLPMGVDTLIAPYREHRL